MKIAMLQLNFTVGDIKGNTEKIIKGYKDACKKGAKLVVSTELALFGYPPKDMLLQDRYLTTQFKYLEKIIGEVKRVGLVIGLAERNTGKGRPLINTVVLIQNKKIIARHIKNLLPNYDVFDEMRYFEPGLNKPNVFEYEGKRMAMLVCEDIWNNGLEKKDRELIFHKTNPTNNLKNKKLDYLIVVNASPYYWGKTSVRYSLVSDIAVNLQCTVIYVNQIGGNDDLVFDGTSFAVDKDFNLLGYAKSFEEDLVILDPKKHFDTMEYNFDDSMKYLYNALVMGTRDYVKKSGFESAIIASSGGIDSALTIAIAVEAIGADRVSTYSMPSDYSSSGSVEDARQLAINFGVGFTVLPIKDEVAAFKRGFKKAKIAYGGVAEENIQARVRGSKMMFISNTNGAIVLTTGNKSETAVGYCTLYGDTAGGLAVISDVPKTLVYRLAHYINYRYGSTMIPKNIIAKDPSAELRPDQKDSDSLPPYDILDEVLKLYIEERRSVDDISRLGFNEKAVRKVVGLVNSNEYKRRQMAPGLKVTTTAFGSGRRFPIAAKFI